MLSNHCESLASDQRHLIVGDHYHRQALLENAAQFWAYFGAASITLGLGIGLVLYVLFTDGLSSQVAAIVAVFGVMLKAVSGLFYRQMIETRAQATAFYDRMRVDERLARAIHLAESIPSHDLQSETKAKLVLYIAATSNLKSDVRHSTQVDYSRKTARHN